MATLIIEKNGSGWAVHSGVGRGNMSWRKKGSWVAVNKERGEMGYAGLQQRKKKAGAGENQPRPVLGIKSPFQFINIFFNLQII
jgi:hypothetical protein